MPELPAGPNPLGAAAPEAQEIQLLWTEAAPEGSDSLVLAPGEALRRAGSGDVCSWV